MATLDLPDGMGYMRQQLSDGKGVDIMGYMKTYRVESIPILPTITHQIHDSYSIHIRS